MPTTPIKLTDTVRSARLRRVDGALVPSVTPNSEIPGFKLIVKTRRAFWCVDYQPRGVNPATGKRWGGGVRTSLATPTRCRPPTPGRPRWPARLWSGKVGPLTTKPWPYGPP